MTKDQLNFFISEFYMDPFFGSVGLLPEKSCIQIVFAFQLWLY